MTKNPNRDAVARDVEDFLARGNSITVVPSGVSGVNNEARKELHAARAKKAAHARRSKTKGVKQ